MFCVPCTNCHLQLQHYRIRSRESAIASLAILVAGKVAKTWSLLFFASISWSEAHKLAMSDHWVEPPMRSNRLTIRSYPAWEGKGMACTASVQSQIAIISQLESQCDMSSLARGSRCLLDLLNAVLSSQCYNNAEKPCVSGPEYDRIPKCSCLGSVYRGMPTEYPMGDAMFQCSLMTFTSSPSSHCASFSPGGNGKCASRRK